MANANIDPVETNTQAESTSKIAIANFRHENGMKNNRYLRNQGILPPIGSKNWMELALQQISVVRYIAADFLNSLFSDHTLILIQSYKLVTLYPKPFRVYENIIGRVGLPKLVGDVWQKTETGHTMQRIWSKLKNIKQQLKDLTKYMACYN